MPQKGMRVYRVDLFQKSRKRSTVGEGRGGRGVLKMYRGGEEVPAASEAMQEEKADIFPAKLQAWKARQTQAQQAMPAI